MPFEKGTFGNLGGRPKALAEVVELARSHTAGAKIALGFIFDSLFQRNHFTFIHGASFLLAPRVRTPFFFSLLKGCAFLYSVIHNFRL
jgi:hypothetical protein